MTASFDYIVVGGGSAGCVTAWRLVKDHGARVLLLEAGWPHGHPLIRMPAGFARMVFRPNRFITTYESEPQPSLDGRSVPIAQANVLGGGSSVNAMTYTRGTRDDYDGWNSYLGGAGWGWKDILPHFIALESNQRLGAPHHGVDGPLRVSDAHYPTTDLSRACLLTLQALGIPYTSDLNSGDEFGATFIQSTTFRGERWSAARAFIDPILNNSRLTIKCRARAARIRIENGRAAGIDHFDQATGRMETAFADAEIILTAGALVTPKLLMLSGVGPADELAKHGIPVVQDSWGVGRNLQDHNDVRMAMHTNRNYGYSGEDRGVRMILNSLQYLLYRAGPVSSTMSEVTAFFNPEDMDRPPTVQLYCLGTLYPQPGDSGPPPVGATLSANLIAPRSRGRVTLRSADPLDPPRIDPNWLSDPADVRALVAGLRFLRKVTQTAPFSSMVKKVILPDPGLTTDDQLARYAREVTMTNWHPVGTCRMGPDGDSTAVLDAKLRVRGVANLRVFDASMMPTILSANINAAVMAIADRAVSMMMTARH
jgi:choline dehydrogenase